LLQHIFLVAVTFKRTTPKYSFISKKLPKRHLAETIHKHRVLKMLDTCYI